MGDWEMRLGRWQDSPPDQALPTLPSHLEERMNRELDKMLEPVADRMTLAAILLLWFLGVWGLPCSMGLIGGYMWGAG